MISSTRFHSASPINSNPSKLTATSRFLPIRKLPRSRLPQSTPCRCQTSSGGDDPRSKPRSWDAVLQDAVNAAVKRWEVHMASMRGVQEEDGGEEEEEEVGTSSARKGKEDDVNVEWDWDRWKEHFQEVDLVERVLPVLRSQLDDAVHREDYRDAAELQRTIINAVSDDAVGRAIKNLNRAIEEEQYGDAANIRDNAGTGLIGWWAGLSEDSSDPHGRIICITAEYGKYVARSFTSRQLASGRPGCPLFEVYFTVGDNGEYRQQAVYLKSKTINLEHPLKKHPGSVDTDDPGSLGDSSKEKGNLSDKDVDMEDSGNDSDVADGLDGTQNVIQDMIPGVKVKVVKILSTGKVDRDLILKVIEQVMDDDDDDDEDFEIESMEVDDGDETEGDTEEMVVDGGDAIIDTTDGQTDLSVNLNFGGLPENFSVDGPPQDLVKLPARLEKQSRLSFSFSIASEGLEKECADKDYDLSNKVPQRPTIHSANIVMSDLAKVIYSRKRIPLKVLKDIGELINYTVNQDLNQTSLHGKMNFSRINIPNTSDPLTGLYVSARGMFSSEVLYLRRKFGQWQDDGKNNEAVDLQFYEFVEALKLTGDPSVPAGQVAFRAKIGKQNQLPHKGIIPEEFGVVARYKGQGRLAEPGFQNPRWVDAELVILDGKYIRDGPVIGFVYWAPEYHFLMFFNRLRLQN